MKTPMTPRQRQKQQASKLRVNKGLALAVFAAGLLAGCASTGGAIEDTVYTGFSEWDDGSATQAVLGVTCPAKIEHLTLSSTNTYNADGTDVSCNYANDADPNEVMTVYLSHYPDSNLNAEFQASVQALRGRFEPLGYSYNEELSQLCANTSMDAAALLDGFSGMMSGQSEENTINLSTSPSAVFVSGTKATLVVLEEAFENEFYKTRYSRTYGGKESIENACTLARETYLNMRNLVRKERGIGDEHIENILSEMVSKEES